MDSRNLRVMVALVCVCLLSTGCVTRRPPPKPPELSEIPVHSCSRTNWSTSAKCMIYPMFGNEGHAGIGSFIRQMAATLRSEGYSVVWMDTYMTEQKRQSVDKILRPESQWQRSRTLGGKRVWDLMVIMSVEDRPDRPLAPGTQPRKRYFQAWGRRPGAMPFREVAEDFLRMEPFRMALEPTKDEDKP